MKLIELVSYLVNPKRLGELYKAKGVNSESEALLIYCKRTLDTESEVEIFAFEETEDDLTYEKEGEYYIQLFPIDHAVSLIESDLDLLNKGLTDSQIANRLLDYRIHDA